VSGFERRSGSGFLLHESSGLAAGAGETAATAKAPEQHLQKAIFAAGCFWGVEDDFRHEKGVVDAISGFTGGIKRTLHTRKCVPARHITRKQ